MFLPKKPPTLTTQTLITFHEKIFEKFFWSQGTPLGYLGFLSQKGRPEIISKWVLINLSNPLRHPAPLVDPLLTKNLDTTGPWCVPKTRHCGNLKIEDLKKLKYTLSGPLHSSLIFVHRLIYAFCVRLFCILY